MRRKAEIIFLAALAALLLCACGRTAQIELSAGSFPEDTEELCAVLLPEDIPLLDGFAALRRADLSGSRCYDELLSWAEEHPQVELCYSVELPDGQEADNLAEKLSFNGLDADGIAALSKALGYLPRVTAVELGRVDAGCGEAVSALAGACPDVNFDFSFELCGESINLTDRVLTLTDLDDAAADLLIPFLSLMSVESIDLGSEDGSLSWDRICAVRTACPQAVLTYAFTLYGKSCTLADSELNLSHVAIDDNGALVKLVTSCMPSLRLLDMDSCGVSDEAMAEIRDSLPDTEVIWRIWFGTNYSVRTDVERIVASKSGTGGELTHENTTSLQYCTKVRLLDLGHNDLLDDISFVACMPDLEVAILMGGVWSDLSPLANCTHLEYAELYTTAISDLSPLAELKELRHLNIGCDYAVHDISPLYGLTELERLWIGRYTPVPPEQIEIMQSCAPNCEIDLTTIWDPCGGGWRYLGEDEYGYMRLAPRYELLREQFGGYTRDVFAFSFNDPLL